jgi:hypothetical protein
LSELALGIEKISTGIPIMTRYNPASGDDWLNLQYLQLVKEFLRISKPNPALLRKSDLNRPSGQFGISKAEIRRLCFVWLANQVQRIVA